MHLDLATQEMAKGLKIPLSFLKSFRMCRVKDPCLLVTRPLPKATYLLSPVNSKSFDISIPTFPNPPPCTPNDSSPKGISPSKIHPLGCESGSQSSRMHMITSELKDELPSQKYSETREVNRKVYGSSMVLCNSNENTKPRTKAKKAKTRFGSSISSGDNDETESLFPSPPSLSTSHDHFTYPLKAITVETADKPKKSMLKYRSVTTPRFKRFGSKDWIDGVVTTPKRKGDGQANNSFVVVKSSSDPYEDFKKSMLEMIMMKQMSEPRELEQLLLSFLSLNSRLHHQVIIEAFTEILKEVFTGHQIGA